MKVLGIGEIILDKSCLFDSYLEEGTKTQPKKVEYSVGGPVPAALILLSRLGADCKLVASMGRDTAGKKIKTLLSKESVQLIPNLQKSTKIATYIVNQENGSRTGIRSDTKHTLLSKFSVKIIKEADLVVFDRHEPKAFEYVIKHKRSNTKIIVDPSTEVSVKTINMFQHADYPILPIESLKKIKRHEDIMENLKALYNISGKPVIITAGSKGSIIYDGEEINFLPANDINPIDTLGAGDIFRGAFGYGVLQNWSLIKSVEYANHVAALQCMRIGNSTAIPTKKEIAVFIKSTKKKSLTINEILN